VEATTKGEAVSALAQHTDTTFVEGYWLGRCEGFRVESPDGPIGFVEEVLGSEPPQALVIRAGRFGTRLLIVSLDEVVAFRPSEERIVLRGSPQILRSAPLNAPKAG
jgi:hypothetical protein